MPSLLDHLDNLEGEDPVPHLSPPADLIDGVKTEGARRRTRRHRRNLGGALLTLGLLTLPAVAMTSGDDGPRREVAVATEGGGTVPDPLPAEVAPVEVFPPAPPEATVPTTAPPAVSPGTTVAPRAGATPTTAASLPAPTTTAAPGGAAPTTTARVCRNSDDPACGEFRWDPAPAPNQPIVASFTKQPGTAVVGQPVEFEVTWSDPDATLSFERFSTDGTTLITACSLAPRYGPWTPPPATPGSGKLPYTTTFQTPGVYKVIVAVGTASCASPYGNDAMVETTVTVA